jgi:hypothetical protein
MNILGIHFHNWEIIKTKDSFIFMDEPYHIINHTGYRYCSQCKSVQKYGYDSKGGSWDKLSECKANAIRHNIYRENGNWFFLNQT